MTDLIPTDVPTRSELWERVCLARSVLSHRAATPETARIALQALEGASIADLTDPSVPAKLVDRWLVVENCPWCGREHTHGAGKGPVPAYGHRVAHCGAGRGWGYYLEPPSPEGE